MDAQSDAPESATEDESVVAQSSTSSEPFLYGAASENDIIILGIRYEYIVLIMLLLILLLLVYLIKKK